MVLRERALGRGEEREPFQPKLVLFDKDRTLLIPTGGYFFDGVDDSVIARFGEGDVMSFTSRRMLGHPEGLLRKGTTLLLQRLTDAGISCGIITRDYEDATQELLEIARLRDFFHPAAILTRDHPVSHKPNQDHFLSAARNLGVDPQQCVMVGDDLHDDISGAQEAGMKTVLVEYHGYGERDFEAYGRPDLVIAHFDELTMEALQSL